MISCHDVSWNFFLKWFESWVLSLRFESSSSWKSSRTAVLDMNQHPSQMASEKMTFLRGSFSNHVFCCFFQVFLLFVIGRVHCEKKVSRSFGSGSATGFEKEQYPEINLGQFWTDNQKLSWEERIGNSGSVIKEECWGIYLLPWFNVVIK